MLSGRSVISELARFSVSINLDLLRKFDRQILAEHYPNRSKAIEDLIRNSLVKKQWIEGEEVAGAIILVFDHHKRNLTNRLTHIQHDYHQQIISTQHIHLDHDYCLEVVVVKGKPDEIVALADKLRAVKGIKHGSLAMTTTGKGV